MTEHDFTNCGESESPGPRHGPRVLTAQLSAEPPWEPNWWPLRAAMIATRHRVQHGFLLGVSQPHFT